MSRSSSKRQPWHCPHASVNDLGPRQLEKGKPHEGSLLSCVPPSLRPVEGLRMTVHQQIHQVLAELELVSHGTTANLAPTGRGSEGAAVPPGESHPPHIHWRERWLGAVDEEDRRRVLAGARRELASLRKRTVVKVSMETEEELEARIIREGRGEPVDRVAAAMRCTSTFVRKARLKAGVSVTTGKAPKGIMIGTVDQREHAEHMAENGATERQIEFVTKLPKTTVRRILGRAA